MLRNYLKSAWRVLMKSKLFSAINIFGLSIGLACFILMFLLIQHELSFDKFNHEANNIYRITSTPLEGKDKKELAVTPAPWAPLMKKEYPEIKEYVRLLKDEKTVIGQPGEQHFYESGLLYADSTFFKIFSFTLERGDIRNALDRPNSVLLTKESARKYFGEADPIGKTLEVNSFGRSFNVEVTGIISKPPENSHFSFQFLVSLQSLGDLGEMWSFHMMQSYVLLNENASLKAIQNKVSGFSDRYIANNPQADGKQDIRLQPLTSIHLHSKMTGELGSNGDIAYIYVFAGVALFILLIACFNFTNLSSARSFSRAKEVGLRKVVGAIRGQLMRQFLGETVVFASIALIIALLIAYLVLPAFNQLAGRQLELNILHNSILLPLLIGLVLFTSLISGLYPAGILASFKPVEVLKGKLLKGSGGISFRKILVTLQFIVSIVLMGCTLVLTKQLTFLQNKKIGFEKENVMVLTLPRNTDSTKLQSFKSSLLNDPGVRSVAASSSVPGTNIPVNQVNDGDADLRKAISMQMLFIDNDFIRTMDMKLVAGRDFSKDHPTDRWAGFVLNEEAVRKGGWKSPSEAIGKPFQWVLPNAVIKAGTIIGVVKDFNITPLKSTVMPLVMHILPQRFQYLYIRFNHAQAGNIVNSVGKTFNEFYSTQSFEYSFLDDTLASMYKNERKLSIIFSYFSSLAIVIACLGIFGLSLYSIQQRMREIGIRKVLGSSIAGVTNLLMWEFIKPILLATIISIPIIWVGMNQWLSNFAYRTPISWWIFLVSGMLVLSIALITIGFQAIKAATANPVKSLRTE